MVAMTIEQRAEKVRTDLFTRYDHLNALWQKAEEQLAKMHIPLPVEHKYGEYCEDWRDASTVIYECLGMQKFAGKWRICYGRYHLLSEDTPDEWTPICECSARVRVRAAKHIPGLREAIVKSAEAFVPTVDEAIQALSESLDQPTDIQKLLAERAKLNGQAP